MKETKIEIPAGCEVEKIETQDGHVLVTFKEKERKLPKSWDEFCEKYPIKDGECVINSSCVVAELKPSSEEFNFSGFDKTKRHIATVGILPDRATAEAVLALCQLIQLRNCYNGDWVPNWTDEERKYTLVFYECEIWRYDVFNTPGILTFKTAELRDEFLRDFRPLIEKIKPLYGIREGGQK